MKAWKNGRFSLSDNPDDKNKATIVPYGHKEICKRDHFSFMWDPPFKSFTPPTQTWEEEYESWLSSTTMAPPS